MKIVKCLHVAVQRKAELGAEVHHLLYVPRDTRRQLPLLRLAHRDQDLIGLPIVNAMLSSNTHHILAVPLLLVYKLHQITRVQIGHECTKKTSVQPYQRFRARSHWSNVLQK